MIATTIDYQKLQDWRPKCLYCCFQLLIVVGIARVSFFALGVVENSRFAVGIVILSVIVPVPEIHVFLVLVTTLPFPKF